MRLLVDTHVLLWSVSGAPMRASATEALRLADEVHLSVVSPWELVVKAAKGRLDLGHSAEEIAIAFVRDVGGRVLPVTLAHVLAVGDLPLHHGDPFDRLLIAQARHEGLTIVTHDAWFSRYDVPVIEA